MKLFALRYISAVLFFCAASCSMASQQFTQAFDDVSAVKLSIVIGGPLDLEDGGMRLFGGDSERSDRFKQTLSASVASGLSSCGIEVDESAFEELSILVFGRPTSARADGTEEYVYLIKLERYDISPDSDDLCYGCPIIGSAIGVVEDHELESVLTYSALRIIASELRDCRLDLDPVPPK